jgi:hypothetical protein
VTGSTRWTIPPHVPLSVIDRHGNGRTTQHSHPAVNAEGRACSQERHDAGPAAARDEVALRHDVSRVGWLGACSRPALERCLGTLSTGPGPTSVRPEKDTPHPGRCNVRPASAGRATQNPLLDRTKVHFRLPFSFKRCDWTDFHGHAACCADGHEARGLLPGEEREPSDSSQQPTPDSPTIELPREREGEAGGPGPILHGIRVDFAARHHSRGRSPREHRAKTRRQRRDFETDSTAEQGLEVGLTRDHTSSGCGDTTGRSVRTAGNDEKASAAVTQQELLSREKLRRAWHCVGPTPEPLQEQRGDTLSPEDRRAGRNVVNPMAGCRVQQTCRVMSGANRRSREKRQGRTAHEDWQPRAEGTPSSEGEPGEDAHHFVRRRGDLWESQERKSESSSGSRPASADQEQEQ